MRKIIFLFLTVLFSSIVFGNTTKNKIVKVACVGNSITYGSGIESPTTDSYPAQLQRILGERYMVANFGKPGATLLNKGHRPYTEQEEYKQALAFAGDIVIIHLGINDTDPRNWVNYRDFFVRDYLSLINELRRANPSTRIIIAQMTPVSDRHPRFESGTRDWHTQIQQAIKTVARVSEVQLIDFHTPLYSYPFMLPDAVHPNKDGARILAETVYSAITGNFGGLQISSLYSDEMILQRDTPLRVSGIANAGEKVSVIIDKKEYFTVTPDNGKWEITLDPLKAGTGYSFTIFTATRKLQFKDVAVGEVWVCSGQSNMEWPLQQTSEAKSLIPHATNPDIRFFDMKARWATTATEWNSSALDSINHLQYYSTTTWQPCTPKSAAQFSAVAYSFGKMLSDSLNIPVGLICNAVGGSTTESWIDRYTLEHEFPTILGDWQENDFIQQWARERITQNIAQADNPLQRHPYEPCYLFEAGIQPLDKFPIRGVIWYQGESNAHNIEAHAKLFKLLIKSWRKNWNNEEMPFYFVQLSSLNRPSWTWFRDSQRRLQSEIPYTGMVVSSDLGDSLDVHPRQKKRIGERLAFIALNKSYEFNHITPSGPVFSKVEFKNDIAFVSFDYAEGLCSSDGKPIATFEVAEYPGLFFPATATVEDNIIRVSSPQVGKPHYVRYGWQPFTRANLINNAGLPASTFTTEE